MTIREHRLLKHDAPASASAYEYYLRANQLTAPQTVQEMLLARDLYLRCLDADPGYAPAWARLGRIHRFIGKFVGEEGENLARAEEAFRKSFSLNPDLALAHNFYTSLEADLGRALSAMERLLKRGQTHRNDPDLFTDLVQARRYCGLLDASVAAHQRARRLDPHAKTSVSYTFRYLNDIQAALNHSSVDEYVTNLGWAPPGREQEALAALREREQGNPPGRLRRAFLASCRTYLEGDRAKSLDTIGQCLELQFRDPEARFGLGALLSKLNEPKWALEALSQALEEGYVCHHMLLHHPWLDSLRSNAAFPVVSRTTERSVHARVVFLDNGGARLLGTAAQLSE